MRDLKDLFQASDWTEEVANYRPIIEKMKESEACQFLWEEYYFKHKLSKKAHNWLLYWSEDICLPND